MTPEDPNIAAMKPIRVQTQMKSQYRFFDISGRLPLHINFGFRRRSDNDTQNISFQVAGTILDVPYALVHGLLSLHELRPSHSGGGTERVEVDLNRLRDAIKHDEPTSENIVLPSKTDKSRGRGLKSFTLYRYRVDPKSYLASLFEAGKKYSIGLANRNLCVHHYINAHQDPSPNGDEIPHPQTRGESVELFSNPHGGFAVFRAVESLTWPSEINTKMKMHSITSVSNAPGTEAEPSLLRVTITSAGPDTIYVQTRGDQRFIVPWSIFEQDSDDGLNALHSPRILDPSATIGSFQVIDEASGDFVQDPRKRGVCSLRASSYDPRPRVEDLFILRPGVPVLREVHIDKLVSKLKDGEYRIRLKPRGCWWHSGELESDADDDGRVPKHCMKRAMNSTPLVLETDDEVVIHVRDGRIVETC